MPQSLAGIYPVPARSRQESKAESAAFDAYEESRYERKEDVQTAVAAAQAAYSSHGGEGEWLWFMRGLVEIGRLKDMKMHELWLLKEKLNVLSRHGTEWHFQCLDEATRRTGQLVKQSRILSVQGFALRMLNMKLVRWDAKTRAAAQDLYPQLLGSMIYIDPPKSLMILYTNVVRPLLPPRLKAKTTVLDSASPIDLQKLDRHCKLECLPTYVGGKRSLTWPPKEDELLPPLGLTTFIRYDVED